MEVILEWADINMVQYKLHLRPIHQWIIATQHLKQSSHFECDSNYLFVYLRARGRIATNKVASNNHTTDKMASNNEAVLVDEKGRNMSDLSINKEEAGIVEEHIDHAAERAYGTSQSLFSEVQS
jgi:hypothetical protein